MDNNIQEALAEVQRRLDEKVGDKFFKDNSHLSTDELQAKVNQYKTQNPGAADKMDAMHKEYLKNKPAADLKPKPSSAPEPTTKPSSAPAQKGGLPATTGAQTAKTGVSTLGKIGRALPVVGAVLGAKDAYDRYQEGDKVGAGIAAAGGLASFIPGAGGVVGSLGAAGANMYRDSQKDKPEKPKIAAPGLSFKSTPPEENKPAPTPTPRPKDIDKPVAPAAKSKEVDTTPATPKVDTASIYAKHGVGSPDEDSGAFHRAEAEISKAKSGTEQESGPKKKKVNEALLEAFYKINR